LFSLRLTWLEPRLAIGDCNDLITVNYRNCPGGVTILAETLATLAK
jgi:hypothetical protein